MKIKLFNIKKKKKKISISVDKKKHLTEINTL